MNNNSAIYNIVLTKIAIAAFGMVSCLLDEWRLAPVGQRVAQTPKNFGLSSVLRADYLLAAEGLI